MTTELQSLPTTARSAGQLRHYLRDDDLSPDELITVLDLADVYKTDRTGFTPLAGQSVALLGGFLVLGSRPSQHLGAGAGEYSAQCHSSFA